MKERLKNNMKASQLRGLSNPTGSGVRSETLDKLRESNNTDVNGSTSSPEDFH